MRPKSIILFERLYLASIAVTAINTWLTYDRTLGQMERDPTLGALGWGAGMFMAVLAVSLLVSLLLYYLVAYRANVIAKWVLVAFTAFGLLGVPGAFATLAGAELVTVLLLNLLALAAVVMLFRPDARDWFADSYGSDGDPSAGE
ncbi:hypothetical protein [Allopontixanthobacter sediminis]|uniref:Uncharacterized protein n=1 Tax=Allopontixanthobacter sediminis TaxID=1689985 RepID=A0A845B306_9SPHN|nr:hypothetical protein [Allopontixanthobacter sediminis]MXP44524.1 hypothetical protein [Allopontixanthobacter sediminis]